jgi:FKBP-type peptidyl-prolyl cis-trans isomerase SlpA
MGDGSLLPGFERRLLGMRAGDEAEFRIPPEEGFGEPQDDNVQPIPRADFDSDTPLEPGMLFTFADAAGGEVPGMIADVDDTTVTVDFNHPLSGRTIHFKVRIAHVEPAELH